MRSFLLRSLIVLFSCVLLAACGFQLRGPRPMPFQTIKLDMDPYAELTANLKRQINASGNTRVVDRAEDAEVRLQVPTNLREKEILALNANGSAREYRLWLRFGYRVVDKAGQEISALTVLNLQREITFSDSAVLAKEQEEAQMFTEMERDLSQQLVRRLAAIKR